MKRSPSQPFFGNMPLKEVTREHGEVGLRNRLSYLVSSQDWDDQTRQSLRRAEELALDFHQHDTRGEHPYSTHFLRVAIRILSPDHLDVQDPELVVAALLHDTVEDHSRKFALSTERNTGIDDRTQALVTISQDFGDTVANLVSAVTNTEYPTGISREQKHQLYQTHVRQTLETNDRAGVIKLSDFIDNCVGLEHNEDPEKQRKLAAKYYPLIPDFRSFVDRTTLLSDETKAYVHAQLDSAELLCIELLS